MSAPSYQPPPGFVPIRDPHTLKLVCYYNAVTGHVVVVQRGGEVRRGTLPDVARTERKGML